MRYVAKTSESIEQQTLFRWAEFRAQAFPELELLYHIPNEGKRNAATGRRLKAEGLKKGVPDLCLPVARGGKHGLYIEMKAGKNKTSPYQDRWLAELSKQGYETAVCYGWEAAAAVIERYLKSAVECTDIDNRILLDGGMCEICHGDLGCIVHHKITLTADNINDPEISLNRANLQHVCHDCHNRIDNLGNTEKNKEDERGESEH